jgi:hypothetical protein
MGPSWRVAAVLSLILAGGAGAQDSGPAGFKQLRTLVGEWEGSFNWTGARSGSGGVKATYFLTGNESALVENLTMGSVLAMTSVYHMDGDDLRMTHYCAAQNQPRLRARRIDLAKGSVDFSFVDATNLPSPDAPHVHGVEIRWLDANHIAIRFLFEAGAQHSQETLDLRRINPSPR